MCVRVGTPWHVWALGYSILLLSMSALAFHYAHGFEPSKYDELAAQLTAASSPSRHWFTGVWALALWTAALGAGLVLLKKQLAFPVLAFALVASAVSLAFSLEFSVSDALSLTYLIFRVSVFTGLGIATLYARNMSQVCLLT